ncbi:MAG: HAD family hydrolase [Bryobacteraceae bacterium]
MGSKNSTRQHLIIDADDTLWENNIYFERAFDDFIAFLNHSSMTPNEVLAVLDEIELASSKTHGYGSANFGRNLRECYERLVEREVRGDDLRMVMSFAERILDEPIEMIAGVEETLEYLALRHDLTLFTKGHPEEQKLKIDRSGVGVYFAHTAIVKEKDPDSYRSLVEERGLPPETSWMVGNSPRSDINPALAAGLNAVFVPHERTWHLEKCELASGSGRLLIVEQFADLRNHF